VFDGLKSRPYRIMDAKHPLGVYGASKAEGEERVQKVLGEAVVIIRTGWVYASEGHNFVNAILRLLREKSSLDVIGDQVGTPTWARSLAECVRAVVDRRDIKGLLHWSDAGVVNWYDFAVAIQEEAMTLGLTGNAIPINPVATEDHPLPAKRPAYSMFDKWECWQQTGMQSCHWRKNLGIKLQELAHA
jgi:dTDP-4-dehydrorhamnose reductase